MQNDESADIAAVAVTRSRLNTWTHCKYSVFSVQMGSEGPPLQIQLPPVSLKIAELTAIIYAYNQQRPSCKEQVEMYHGEEGGKTSSDFGGEETSLSDAKCIRSVETEPCPHRACSN